MELRNALNELIFKRQQLLNKHSKKYINQGKLDIILNQINKKELYNSMELIDSLELNLIGYIDNFEEIDYDKIVDILKASYLRMNLTQNN